MGYFFCKDPPNVCEFNVYISFSEEDKDKAEKTFLILSESCNFKVLMNQQTNENFEEKSQYGITNSNCLLAIITKNYLNEEKCCSEFKQAHKLKKKLFLVLFEKVELDKSTIGLQTMGIQRCNLYKNEDSSDFTKSKEFEQLMQEIKSFQSN